MVCGYKSVMNVHVMAFFSGFLLDLLFGDPYFLPHPIRLIGTWIRVMEGWMLRKEDGKKTKLRQGRKMVFLVLFTTTALTAALLILSYRIHSCVGMAVEAIMTYQILAVKCLETESMKVYHSLQNGDLKQAREAVSMIVGRDTAHLDEEGIIKAAVETVAENTSDGVIAPMLYTAIGGPVLGFFYKAVNTMDSMVGYQNETYLYFGRAAAKLDDIVNFFPSRISAVIMILSSALLGKEFSAKHAWRIYRRDHRKHKSPNSAQTESVCAGALGIRLAGDAVYFGKTVKKPYIGDELRSVEVSDIKRVNRLLYLSSWLCEIVCMLFLLFVQRIC